MKFCLRRLRRTALFLCSQHWTIKRRMAKSRNVKPSMPSWQWLDLTFLTPLHQDGILEAIYWPDISSIQSFLSQEAMSFPRIVASVSEVEFLSPTKLRKTMASVSFLDYNLQPSHSKKSGEWMNTLAVGTTFGVNL